MRQLLIVELDYLLHSDNWGTMFMERLVGGITMHKSQPLGSCLHLAMILTFGHVLALFVQRNVVQEWPVCIQ